MVKFQTEKKYNYRFHFFSVKTEDLVKNVEPELHLNDVIAYMNEKMKSRGNRPLNFIFSFIFLMIIPLSGLAQVAASWNYITKTGTIGTTYSWIDCSSGSSVVSGDDAQGTINWPFTFKFYDNTYTTANNLSVCSNGYIRLDGVASTNYNDASSYNLASGATNLGQIICTGIYDNNIGPNGGWCRSRVTGTSPNRILTIEYHNLEIDYNDGKYASVQVSFYETSNKVVLKFGTENISKSSVDMGIHSGVAGYFDYWKEVNGSTSNTWIEYSVPNGIFVNGVDADAALTGFSYYYGFGPSAEQSFTVSGSGLSDNLILTAPPEFEISTDTGAAFVPSPTLTLNVTGGKVDPVTVYVRMKAGLPSGTVGSSNIVCSSTGLTSRNVVCSGTVKASPVITVNPSSLSGFTYELGNGPSTIVPSFTVGGTGLSGSILVSPPADYEISLSATSGFTLTPITLTPTNGTVNTTTFFVRLKSGLAVGDYNEQITIASDNTVPQAIILTGNVSNVPTINTSTTYLGGFIYTFGAGPSSVQSFVVTGTLIKSSGITITPPSNFRIALSAAGPFSSGAIVLPQSGGSVGPTTIYVQMPAGLAVGTYSLQDIVCSATSAINKNVTCDGAVASSSTRTILGSPTSLNGFSYLVGSGPSIVQNFTVSGASLTANIVVTPPATGEFEISQSSTGPYSTSAITLTQSGGKVNPTIIYVRLKAGLAVNSYSNKIINLTSSGATSKSINCNGLVYSQPTITAGVSGAVCSTINLTSTASSNVANQYWTGPQGFYSLDQNPVISGATTANSGTYTVTGSVPIGINLVTNGDFESGNTGFSSSYTYKTPSGGTTLWDEGTYTVVANPNTVHSNFSSCADHSNPGTLQMVINGAGTAGIFVWRQTVNVLPNSYYQFTYWVQSVYASAPSVLQLYVNGVSAGPQYTAITSTCQWKQFVYNWYSGTSTTAELSLINQNIATSGNDFALDDIVFQQTLSVTSSVNVTVNPALPVSVNLTASANPILSGTSVTFTASPVNGGSSPIYQWKVNGAIVGTNSSTFAYTPNNGDVISCTVTSNYPCTSGNPATASITITVKPHTNFWSGSVDTNWGNAANWTAGFVPLGGDDVEFATNINYGSSAKRELILDADRAIGHLINLTDMSLIVPPGKSLSVNNTITTDGNSDRIYIQSSHSAANGSLIFHNAASSPVNGTVEMYTKAKYDPTGLTYNGITYHYTWQFFGIPLKVIAANPTFAGSFVREYDETKTITYGKWVQLTNSSILYPYKGYEITQLSPKTLVFKGTLVNNDTTISLATTTGAYDPGQHILSNPYTAGIDIRKLTFGTNTEGTIYLYNTGSFVDWINGGSESGGGFNSVTPGQYQSIPNYLAGAAPGIPYDIPSMQGFLVKTQNSATGSLTIPYSAVITKNVSQQRVSGADEPYDKTFINVNVQSDNTNDNLWLFKVEGTTRGFDNGWDGEKISASYGATQIFAMDDSIDYQVCSSNDINGTYIGFQSGKDTRYTLTFTSENIKSQYQGVYLVDLVENKTIDITESGAQYTFDTEPQSEAVKRFMIITDFYEKNEPDNFKKIKIFSADNTIFVHNYSDLNGYIIIYDIAGHAIKQAEFNSDCVTSFALNGIPGAYIVSAYTSKERVGKRLIIR